jgi:hypothetical protein
VKVKGNPPIRDPPWKIGYGGERVDAFMLEFLVNPPSHACKDVVQNTAEKGASDTAECILPKDFINTVSSQA